MNPLRPRILIVEDDTHTAAKYKRALERIGDSETAERADQVFKQIIDFDPHLILLDIVLEENRVYAPEEAGIQILKEIRGLKSPFGEIPVIVITALIDSETETKCRELGAVEFFRKPLDMQVLREAVARVIMQQIDRTQQRLNVFISSSMKDLQAERSTVRRAIQELGGRYTAVLAEDWTACAESVVKIWRRAARECDVFVLLLGKEYGTPSPETGISPIEDEYNQARENRQKQHKLGSKFVF